jgi:small subunit ribosomal protein S3
MASERKFVTEKVRRVLLKEFVQARVTRAGFGGLDVQRTPMGTRVTLITERPGLVIGRRGEAIKSLTKAIEDDFKFNNPQIEVQEVENPNLNAQIMAEKLANALERGWHFRRAGHSTVRRIMESGAKGCQVVISGKLTGQRHRTEKFKDGHIKYCGQAKLDFMQNGFAVAKLKPGVIGVTVRIMDPTARLPDEIDIFPPEAPAAPAEAPEAPAPEAKEEEKKVDEAVQELKKAVVEAKPEEKPKRRRKKEGEAPAAEGEEKKPRKRKKKDEGETKAEEPAPAKEEPKAEQAPETAPETAPEPKPAEETPLEPPVEEPAEPSPEPPKEE